MAQRKPLGLRTYLMRYLLVAFAGTLAVIALGVGVFLLAMATGVVLPANAGEIAAAREATTLSERGSFDPDIDAQLYDYAYFDKNGEVAATSLSDKALAQAQARYANRGASYANARYVDFPDGSSALLAWSYALPFSNPALRSFIPDATFALGALVLAGLIGIYLLLARTMSRKLDAKLELVEAASAQIAEQNLDHPIPAASGIKEFDHALASMDDMRKALGKSLAEQWESEQQRKEEITSLAHDIKTPLTVINGSAELLLEDALDDEQQRLAASILDAGQKTRRYVTALQQVSRLDATEKTVEDITLENLIQGILATLAPLARKKQISLDVLSPVSPRALRAYPSVLVRALTNIGENAVRFTPDKGHIVLTVEQSSDTTTFTFDDEGPGFSTEAIEHAHEMFWQQDKSRSDQQHYGMGLAIATKAAALHNGHLKLEAGSRGARVRLVICG